MDIRLILVVMAVALVMDLLGRMARKRTLDGELEEGEVIQPGMAPPEAWERPEAWGAARDDEPELQDVRERRPAPSTPREAAEAVLAALQAPAPAATRARVPAETAAEVRAETPHDAGWQLAGTDPVEPAPAAPVERVRTRLPAPPVQPEPAAPAASPQPGATIDAATPRPAWELEFERAAPERLPERLPARRPAARSRARDIFALESAHDLRRAVIVREVLGPPVALRDRDPA